MNELTYFNVILKMSIKCYTKCHIKCYITLGYIVVHSVTQCYARLSCKFTFACSQVNALFIVSHLEQPKTMVVSQ